ncbi:hypothetical protein [Pontibacter arcticus]|uniref:Uncharacterized protein n=1 Tax=Pontibacter arcticus TaxID=2080288 RepID=A0A364RBT3_9BACT|nr:hypothetical protein [Pontibacter arcticus]RAU81788.1 hypothetical protein DP923_13895 [Pontibacter arcticus]
MGLKNIVDKVKEEIKVLQGDASKDKVYANEQEFADEAAALAAFKRSQEKLFDVNRWSELEGFNSTFTLYDANGNPAENEVAQEGFYMQIILPASPIENWVRITDVRRQDNLVEFTVHPSEKPKPTNEGREVTQHFFVKEASSTFRVTKEGIKLAAFEIGKNETINNTGEEAGNRALLNTLVAEGGWAGVQALQWDKLTRYLVHLEEPPTADTANA